VRRLLALALIAGALGGCSFAGSLHLGDVSLALGQGLQTFGSHVAIAFH
jgi:hypothetical protein